MIDTVVTHSTVIDTAITHHVVTDTAGTYKAVENDAAIKKEKTLECQLSRYLMSEEKITKPTGC